MAIICRVVENDAEESSVIRARLAGARVLITGVTGFLGTALFERLLSDFSDMRFVLLVRTRYGSPPESRRATRSGRSASGSAPTGSGGRSPSGSR